MRISDAIQQFQAIVYETELDDNLVDLAARESLSKLGQFLTKELGSGAVIRLKNEATSHAKNHAKHILKK